MDTDSSTGVVSALAPAANEKKATAGGEGFEFDGTVFAVTTDGNEVAEVLEGGALRVLGSESFFDGATRHHFVDVQGEYEAMLLLVSVREDQRRVVGVRRFS